MRWLNLHAKVKAAAYTYGALVSTGAAAYFNGTVTLHEFLVGAASGALTLATAYFKSA